MKELATKRGPIWLLQFNFRKLAVLYSDKLSDNKLRTAFDNM